MAKQLSSLAVDFGALDDSTLVSHAQAGHSEAFRHIMQRCNQRLFRMARGVLNNDAEAEDVVQAAYVDAFENLQTFRGEAALLTWMTRIVLNEAYGRIRQRKLTVDPDQIEAAQLDHGRVIAFPSKFGSEDPAAGAARAQVRTLVEQAVDDLPEHFRIVFVMREIEECTVEETAAALDLRPETVKTRLHRARRLLRGALNDKLVATLGDVFPFLGPRCARMTASILEQLDARATGAAS